MDQPPIQGQAPAWRPISRSVSPADERTVRPRAIWLQLLAGVLFVLVLVGLLSTLAARTLAEREAVNDAAGTAGVIADTLIQPALNAELRAGSPEAVAAFDQAVRKSVLTNESVIRVKLWGPDGQVLYADEPQLIGRTFPLDSEQLDALEGPATMAHISDLEESENTFESGDRAVEVYRPVWFPDGSPALFEMYLSYDPVGDRRNALWRGFAGLTASSLVLLVVLITPIVWHLTRRLRAAEAQRVALLQRAVDASEEERLRIAANLHDGPVQQLAASSFTAAGAAATARAEGEEALARDLEGVAASVRTSIRALRTLLVDIYPPSLGRAGLIAALTDLGQAHQAEGQTVQLDLDPEAANSLAEPETRLVYRVTQECLRNTAKHAGPAEVLVRLSREGETAVLDVVDDGVGFDVTAALARPAEGHFGLRVLSELTSVPGVRLDVSSAPGAGTHWRLTVHTLEVGK